MTQSTKALDELLGECPPPGLYAHYEGGIYRVIGKAVLEAKLEPLVIYQCHLSGITWACPLREWRETVRVGDEAVPRFAPVRW